jgi:hypothetical protein
MPASALSTAYTTLKADMDAVFNDAKDGLLGLRLAHELQMPDHGRSEIYRRQRQRNRCKRRDR